MEISIHRVTKVQVSDTEALKSGDRVRTIRLITSDGEELTVTAYSTVDAEIVHGSREDVILRRI